MRARAIAVNSLRSGVRAGALAFVGLVALAPVVLVAAGDLSVWVGLPWLLVGLVALWKFPDTVQLQSLDSPAVPIAPRNEEPLLAVLERGHGASFASASLELGVRVKVHGRRRDRLLLGLGLLAAVTPEQLERLVAGEAVDARLDDAFAEFRTAQEPVWSDALDDPRGTPAVVVAFSDYLSERNVAGVPPFEASAAALLQEREWLERGVVRVALRPEREHGVEVAPYLGGGWG